MKTQKNSSGDKAIVVIAAICIVIYISAVVQLLVRLYLNIEQRKTTAETEFANIADLASSAGVLGFMDEPFKDTITEALMLSKSIEAVIISGPDGEYVFERRKDSSVIWVNNSPRFKNRFDLLNVNFYQPLRIHGLRNVNIQAAALSFDYAGITKILKHTLLIILIGFIIAFFTFIIRLLSDKTTDTIAEDAAAPDNAAPVAAVPATPPPSNNVSARTSFNPVPITSVQTFPKNTGNPPASERVSYENKSIDEISEAVANAKIDDTDFDYSKNLDVNEDGKNDGVEIDNLEIDDLEIDDFDVSDLEISDQDVKDLEIGDIDDNKTFAENDNAETVSGNDDEIRGPKGQNAPRSDIGREENTIGRLDTELHNCASAENDLTLIVLEFTHGISDSQYASAAEEAVNYFTSRELLFENGKYGITIIYPGIDIETGIKKAQGFQRRINEKLKLGNEISIGLSSRAGRLLTSGRILMEAMEALEKAKTDHTSSIIAFKSDPEKYRAFLGKQKS